jgi:hypothetical protein
MKIHNQSIQPNSFSDSTTAEEDCALEIRFEQNSINPPLA